MKYSIPFDCDVYKVDIMQGFNGPFSHYDLSEYKVFIDLSFAVDFILPVGAEVVAARAGVVKMVFDGSDKYYDGINPSLGNNLPMFSTNLVIVEHGDGTFALYSHLGMNSIQVMLGQNVLEGQVLAYTGLSGWVGPDPHLHFFVYEEELWRKKSGRGRSVKLVSKPIQFKNYDGPLEHEEIFGRNRNKGRA